jgi:hypothetical protein
MSYLYSLYDALVSINVPSDKARAVVDAMEHDMLTHLATKPDLDNMRSATKAEFENLRSATKAEFENLRAPTKAEFENLRAASKAEYENLRTVNKADVESLRLSMRSEVGALGSRLDALQQEVRLELELLRSSMTVRLGSILAVGLGVLFAALKLTGP